MEDAACALARCSFEAQTRRLVGEVGHVQFHPRKAITNGEGGLIATDDERLTWRLRALRNHR
jgi:perosamine synthetase